MPICYLGMGSNLGDRHRNIKLALQKIKELSGTQIIKVSKIIETHPVGGPPQGEFLNAALKIKTNLSPSILLRKLKTIEKELGRKKIRLRYGPRPIDLDILFYGDKIIDKKDLKIPHPKVFAREFVRKPLLEVI